MNCFYYPETPIVATCQDCNKGLCVDCASKYTSPICKHCNSLRITNEIKRIRIDFIQVFLIGTIVAFLLFFHTLKTSPSSHTDLKTYLIAGLGFLYSSFSGVVGWKTLN